MVGKKRTHFLLGTGASPMPMAQERDCLVGQAQRAFKKETALLSDVQTTLIRKEKLAGGLNNPTAKNTPPTS